MNHEDDHPQLPADWEWSCFGEVAEYTNGRGFGKEEWENEGRPIIRIQNLTGTADSFNYYSGPVKDKYLVPDGTLLISWSATLGAYIWRGEEAILNQHIYKVDSHIDKKYLYYLADFSADGLMQRAHGSGMKHVTKNVFESYPLPVPPLPEQRRIVAKIEELFSDLDAGVADLKRAKKQLERYRKSVLQAAVEGRLTADWRRTHDPEPAEQLLGRILEERREQWEEDYRAKYEKKGKELPKYWKNRYSPPDEPDLPDNLHEVPERWTWTSIGYMCDMTSGGTPKRSNDSYWRGDIPWLKSGELNDGLVTEAEERVTEKGLDESSTNIFPSGTLLVALYGATTGKLGILNFPSATNQAVCGLFVTESLNTKYLFWYLRQFRPELLSKRFGGAQKNISQTILKQVPVPLPPLAEQKQIVDEVERLLSVADDAAATAERENTRAERLRQSILKQAFSGRLVPHDQGAPPPLIDGAASERSDSDAGDGIDSDTEDLLGSTDPDKQIEMDL